MSEEFCIGKIIQKKMEEEGRMVEWLAKKIPCHRNNIYRIYRQKHIHPELLVRICMILKYNFFIDYCNYVDEKISNIFN